MEKKFTPRRNFSQAGKPPEYNQIKELDVLRDMLCSQGLIGWRWGMEPNSNEVVQFGYGSVSQRIEGPRKPFIITGLNTGRKMRLDPEDYTSIQSYNLEKNMVIWNGLIEPPPESLTHAKLIEFMGAGVVAYLHDDIIWRNADRLEIPVTGQTVEEGTLEMCEEIENMYRSDERMRCFHVFAVGSHQGVVVYGQDHEDVLKTSMKYYFKARTYPPE